MCAEANGKIGASSSIGGASEFWREMTKTKIPMRKNDTLKMGTP